MKFDLHIHSIHSKGDGVSSPNAILNRASNLGLDGIAITDHNNIKGSLAALGISPDFGILVVSGVEISTSKGHVLAYGIREDVPMGMSIGETIDRIHDLSGIAVAAHPFDTRRSGVGDAVFDEDFDAIEAINGADFFGASRTMDALKRLKVGITAGSDAHTLGYIGTAYTVAEQVSSSEELLEMIRKGKTTFAGNPKRMKFLIELAKKKMSLYGA